MATQKLLRLSGLALMVGGIILVVHYITHPPGETAQYTFYPLWVLSHWLGGIAHLLILFGLMGLYLHQSEKVGLLGLVGFILAFVGNALFAGGQLYFGAVFQPFVAIQAPHWLEPNSPLLTSSAYRLAVSVTNIPLLLGFLLLSVMTLRAGMLPRLGSWLIILLVPIGVLGLAFIGTPLQEILQIFAGLVWGLGLLIWGYALWSQKGEMIAQAKTTV